FAHGPVNGSRTPILMSSASADPNGKQAKPAASTSHERARKKVCNCLVIDVLPPQRRFTELCRRLSEQATLRDCCNIESTELSQPFVYDIGPCRYKKSRIVLRGCYGASRYPPPPCQDCSGGRIRVVLEQKSQRTDGPASPAGCNLRAGEQRR